MNHVVLFSGGIGSWAAAMRVRETVNPEELTLLFTDTLIEDDDLYRFLEEGAESVGGTLLRLSDGRTPWDVFNDNNMIGNNRAAICSRILKREITRDWFEKHTDPAETTVYIGIDWSESHRFDAARDHWLPWTLEAPLCEPPYKSKHELLDDLRAAGIEPPRMYAMGFPHNNCGGFCVRAGHGTFERLLVHFPERFKEHEDAEQAFRDRTGKDVAILRDRTGGNVKPLTLRQFRNRIESNRQMTLDLLDFGGCGCFVDDIAAD